MKLTGYFALECNRCHAQYHFRPDHAHFKQFPPKEEKGRSVEYTWEKEFLCRTKDCGNFFRFGYTIRESRSGNAHSYNIDIEGGTLISAYELEL